MPEQEAFNPEQFSKLAADTPARIREQDVYRLLDNCDESDRLTLFCWLVGVRPDLTLEARAVAAELHWMSRAPDGADDDPRPSAAQGCERLSERPEWRRARASFVSRPPRFSSVIYFENFAFRC